MLFNEPKLLKSSSTGATRECRVRFSALQRAEIAEIVVEYVRDNHLLLGFSALQRAEIAEIQRLTTQPNWTDGFSALQRAEIAEIAGCETSTPR